MLLVGEDHHYFVRIHDLCDDDDIDSSMMRWLVANTTTTTTTIVQDATAVDDTSTDVTRSSTKNLIGALRIYGFIWVVGLAIYCVLRRRWPRIYAVRQWVTKIRTTLADDQLGTISWLWKVRQVSDDKLLHEIGLDALCFLRLTHMGLRLSLVGMFNSIWLIPVYISVAVQQKDTVDAASDFSVNAFDRRKNEMYYICTVLASYVFFGYAFYTILYEFRWFVRQRHAWLTQLRPQNYTILVRNIPKHLRSDVTLREHFTRLYGANRVLEANCCLFLTHLESLVQRRATCIANLERATAEFQHRGKRPRHKLAMGKPLFMRRYKDSTDDCDNQVDSMDAYTTELEELNDAIAKSIRAIQQKSRPRLMVKGSAFRSFEKCGSDRMIRTTLARRTTNESTVVTEVADDSTEVAIVERQNNNITARMNALWAADHARRSDPRNRTRAKIKAVARMASTSLTREKDGTPDDAGFVTFTSLVAMHGALQMKQHPDLFAMETETAPEPSEIFWNNVGKDRGVLQIGRLISVAMTLTLCLFWTFVVSFIVGLTDPDHLATVMPSLSSFLDHKQWIGKFLKFLSPVLLLVFNSGLLPIILKAVSRFECPASDSILEASAFWKMAAFTVIQTFFVSLISGSVTVTEKIEAVYDNPHEFVQMLGRNLPKQDAYFMQLLTVSTCIGTLLELYRVIPLFQCAVRQMLGHNLTEKQRRQEIGPFKLLSVVDKIYFSRLQARFLLYFMVLFVYSTISPLVNWFCWIFFLFLGSVYRHQFIYNYPNTPDSGGIMWIMFMAVVLTCIVVAQITLWGFLGIKKAGVAISTMIPLMVVTGLFIVYLIQNFFSLGRYLPAHTGLGQDLDNAETGVDFEPFRNLYRNPALGVLENDGGDETETTLTELTTSPRKDNV